MKIDKNTFWHFPKEEIKTLKRGIMREKEIEEAMEEMECWHCERHLKGCEKCRIKYTK